MTTRGEESSFARHRGRRLVLTFMRPYGDARAASARRLLGRLGEVRRRLRTDIARDTAWLILLLDDPGAGTVAEWLPRGRDWQLAAGPQAPIRDLAARFGVLVWDGDAELAGQSFVTVVATPDGRVAELLPGLDGWSPADLLGAIVGAR